MNTVPPSRTTLELIAADHGGRADVLRRMVVLRARHRAVRRRRLAVVGSVVAVVAAVAAVFVVSTSVVGSQSPKRPVPPAARLTTSLAPAPAPPLPDESVIAAFRTGAQAMAVLVTAAVDSCQSYSDAHPVFVDDLPDPAKDVPDPATVVALARTCAAALGAHSPEITWVQAQTGSDLWSAGTVLVLITSPLAAPFGDATYTMLLRVPPGRAPTINLAVGVDEHDLARVSANGPLHRG